MSARQVVREEQKAIIRLLLSDLYDRVALPEDANKITDGEWKSPLGWRVRLSRPDLADDGTAPRVDATIFAPNGEQFAYMRDVTAEDVDRVLP